jgi:hypothetical protein
LYRHLGKSLTGFSRFTEACLGGTAIAVISVHESICTIARHEPSLLDRLIGGRDNSHAIAAKRRAR